MKTTQTLTALASAVVVISLGGLMASQAVAQVASPNANANANDNASVQSSFRFGRHPNLTRALNSLNSADRDLRKAPHIYDGHRAAAQELTEKAIVQVRQALAFNPKGHLTTDWSFGGHPDLNRALKSLERADKDLREAPHEFGGHRAAAEDLTSKAIVEVKKALAVRHRR